MRGPDVLLFAVGLVIFSGSVYGLYQTGGLGSASTSAFGAFNVKFTPDTAETEVATFGTDGSVEFAFNVTEPAQSVTVVVDCAHTVAVPSQVSTQVSVEVTGPNGLTGTGSGACGAPVEVVVEAYPAPKDGLVEAADSDAAAAAAEQEQLNATAVGDWAGTVTFTSAGPGVSLTPVQYAGTVTAAVTTYQAAATPVASR